MSVGNEAERHTIGYVYLMDICMGFTVNVSESAAYYKYVHKVSYVQTFFYRNNKKKFKKINFMHINGHIERECARCKYISMKWFVVI